MRAVPPVGLVLTQRPIQFKPEHRMAAARAAGPAWGTTAPRKALAFRSKRLRQGRDDG